MLNRAVPRLSKDSQHVVYSVQALQRSQSGRLANTGTIYLTSIFRILYSLFFASSSLVGRSMSVRPTGVHREIATVDPNNCAGRKSRCVGGEEKCQTLDVVGNAQPAHGDSAEKVLTQTWR